MHVELRNSPRICWNDNRVGYLKRCEPFIENKFTFLGVVPDGRVVCARCEAERQQYDLFGAV